MMLKLSLIRKYHHEESLFSDSIECGEYSNFYTGSGIKKKYFFELVKRVELNFKESKLFSDIVEVIKEYFPIESFNFIFDNQFKSLIMSQNKREVNFLITFNNEFDFKLIAKYNPYISTYSELNHYKNELQNKIISILWENGIFEYDKI